MAQRDVWVTCKQVDNRDSKDTRVKWLFKHFEQDGTLKENNILQYEFINLGSKIAYINNLVLEPIRIAPGINTHWKWSPPMNVNEFDTTTWYIRFEP